MDIVGWIVPFREGGEEGDQSCLSVEDRDPLLVLLEEG